MYLKKYFCIDINFKALCMYYLYMCLIDFILSLQVVKSNKIVTLGYPSALNNIVNIAASCGVYLKQTSNGNDWS